MQFKSGEVPERCCVILPRFEERSPSNFMSSSLRQDREVPSRPQVLRAPSPGARPDLGGTRSSREPGAYEIPDILPQNGISISIAVIEGPSKGLTYQLNNFCITMGRIGGGADFEFDEPEASDFHCVIAARQAGVRLYVGASVNNVYVNDQRISTVELAHMSTFRVGSSLLRVSILPNQRADVRTRKSAEK